MPIKCQADYCEAPAETVVSDPIYGERWLCAACAEYLGYTEDRATQRAAELRMERDALHRLNGGWPDYPGL